MSPLGSVLVVFAAGCLIAGAGWAYMNHHSYGGEFTVFVGAVLAIGAVVAIPVVPLVATIIGWWT